MNIVVTGGAGFIGSSLVDKLLLEGHKVTVIDNFDPYYDSRIKRRNIHPHLNNPNYILVESDIRDYEAVSENLKGKYDVIVHLAAKAGVRPSLEDPITYQDVNVKGSQNLLEFAKERGIKKFIFASSSSVYGVNPNVPWRENDAVLMPISPYASTKVSGELLGHVYSHLYGINFIGLRFFTVYGPRQRPDLAINKFVRLILEGQEIPIFGDGSTRRDYTYIGDIVDGLYSAISLESKFEIINLGNSDTVTLSELIETLEDVLGCKAKLKYFPEQPGDVPQTYADITKARQLLDYKPQTKLYDGVERFEKWLRGCKKDLQP